MRAAQGRAGIQERHGDGRPLQASSQSATEYWQGHRADEEKGSTTEDRQELKLQDEMEESKERVKEKD